MLAQAKLNLNSLVWPELLASIDEMSNVDAGTTNIMQTAIIWCYFLN